MVNPECLKGYEFLNIFILDYENLMSIGFSDLQIKKMLGGLGYVKDFVDTPDWLECVNKIPKGYKWSDGTKFHLKSGKKNEPETYVFLMVEDDLYIKGLLDNFEWVDNSETNEFGNPRLINVRDKRICLIRNWKSLKSHKVVYALDAIMTSFLESSFYKFWNDNGGKMSMQEDNELADMIAEKLFNGKFSATE